MQGEMGSKGCVVMAISKVTMSVGSDSDAWDMAQGAGREGQAPLYRYDKT
jgi:hypothetical protein